MVDSRLVGKGRNEPLKGLVQQARAHIELGKKHAAALSENGWSAEDNAQLEASVKELDTGAATKSDAFEVAMGLGDAEQKAIDNAKTFIRKLRNALPRALRESPVDGVSAASFKAGGELGRSTPKISEFLNAIRPSVVRMDEGLKRAFNGTAPSTILDTVKTALDTADSVQETALGALPGDTQKIYETKGRVLEMIEDLNRAGKNAFDGNATMTAMFNKDILLRARKEKREAKDPTPTP